MKISSHGGLGDLSESEDPEEGEPLSRCKVSDNSSSLCLPEVDSGWNKENVSTPLCIKPAQAEESSLLSKTAEKTRRHRRKPSNPQKSPSLCDPNFCGVTIYFRTVLQGQTSKLQINHYYSRGLPCTRVRRRRLSHALDCDHGGWGIGGDCGCEEPEDGKPLLASAKCCASCGTRRTPLWRDAEDGTSLCNACGIRYRKYRLRCDQCWHIPRKDSKMFPACSQCGGTLRFTQCKKI